MNKFTAELYIQRFSACVLLLYGLYASVRCLFMGDFLGMAFVAVLVRWGLGVIKAG